MKFALLVFSYCIFLGLSENEVTKKLNGTARLNKTTELISALIQQYTAITGKLVMIMM